VLIDKPGTIHLGNSPRDRFERWMAPQLKLALLAALAYLPMKKLRKEGLVTAALEVSESSSVD